MLQKNNALFLLLILIIPANQLNSKNQTSKKPSILEQARQIAEDNDDPQARNTYIRLQYYYNTWQRICKACKLPSWLNFTKKSENRRKKEGTYPWTQDVSSWLRYQTEEEHTWKSVQPNKRKRDCAEESCF